MVWIMDALEMQAMLIRHTAAMKLVGQFDLAGRWDLLRMVVDPDEEELEVSLLVAERNGVSHVANEMAVRAASQNARRRAYSL